MELDDVRAFARIAELLSISGAARALGAPKSSVSRSLGRLEADLGAILLERGTRSLRLTDAGRLFLPHAQRVLSDVDEAAAALEGLIGQPRGTLRVNAAVTFALGMVAPMLPDFARRYPEVRVVLETENRMVDFAREDVDVAIRVGAMADSDLLARKIGLVELLPCASPDYIHGHGSPQQPRDLVEHTLLTWTDRSTTWRFTDTAGVHHDVSVSPGTVAPEPAVMQILVAKGLGIARLPDFLVAPLIDRGELIRLLPEYQTETVEVHAVYPAHRSLSAKVKLFIDALQAAAKASSGYLP